MAQHIDLSELRAMLSQFLTVGGADGDRDYELIICVECNHVVGRAERGEAFMDVLFDVSYEHDCEDEMAETVVVDPEPVEYTEQEVAEAFAAIEPPPGIGPIRNESPLPKPTAELMVGLLAEIQYVYDEETFRQQREQDERGEAA